MFEMIQEELGPTGLAWRVMPRLSDEGGNYDDGNVNPTLERWGDRNFRTANHFVPRGQNHFRLREFTGST